MHSDICDQYLKVECPYFQQFLHYRILKSILMLYSSDKAFYIESMIDD